MRRAARGLSVVAGGMVAAAAVVAITPGTLTPTTAGAAQASGPTATVERRTLVDTSELDGTLGFGAETPVVNQATGTVTGRAGDGDVVGRGQRLYEVDGLPVVLLFGDRPAWRRLDTGVDDGPDVRQLEENLVAMGFATTAAVKVDDRFTAATAAAVKRWEKALGVTVDGAVDLGQAVFLAGAVRVTSSETVTGERLQPGQKVLTVTADEQVVTIDLAADDRDSIAVGDDVEVELPDGTTTPGTVASVAKVATKGSGEEGQETDPTVAVTVTLDDPAAAAGLEEAPVAVHVARRRAEGVLAVPVNALLALAEGGYGVELADGRLVAVETGLFADGFVEVTGDGIEEGTDVVVPA